MSSDSKESIRPIEVETRGGEVLARMGFTEKHLAVVSDLVARADYANPKGMINLIKSVEVCGDEMVLRGIFSPNEKVVGNCVTLALNIYTDPTFREALREVNDVNKTAGSNMVEVYLVRGWASPFFGFTIKPRHSFLLVSNGDEQVIIDPSLKRVVERGDWRYRVEKALPTGNKTLQTDGYLPLVNGVCRPTKDLLGNTVDRWKLKKLDQPRMVLGLSQTGDRLFTLCFIRNTVTGDIHPVVEVVDKSNLTVARFSTDLKGSPISLDGLSWVRKDIEDLGHSLVRDLHTKLRDKTFVQVVDEERFRRNQTVTFSL